MRMGTVTMVTLAALALAACGGSAGAASASPSSSAGQRGFNRGAAGELVQLNGNTLVLSTNNGDTTVQTSPTTTVQKASTGSFADIVQGSCVFATGTKDASGTVSAAMVTVSNAVNGTCRMNRFGGGASGAPGNAAAPNPARTPNPNRGPCANQPNCAFVSGLVTAVQGTKLTVQTLSGPIQNLEVPTTVRVNKITQASLSDLAVDQCVAAAGARNSSGTVQATNLTIVPPGPSGCFTGGGFGRFGGGRGGGGGGAGGDGFRGGAG